MNVIIKDNLLEVYKEVSQRICLQVKLKKDSFLGLATGRTMEEIYLAITKQANEESIDFSNVVTFNLDEYVGLSSSDNQSYHYYMKHHLFDKLNICYVNFPIMHDGDLAEQCQEFENKISNNIDLQLLGIGNNGHIGFNEPGTSFGSKTHIQVLHMETIKQNKIYFENREMPKLAATMGIDTILNTKQAILVATGKHKAKVVQQAIEGAITSSLPASALQLHPSCTYILDKEAASMLENIDYYNFCQQVLNDSSQ